MKDQLVIDIETKNTFADVGGKENLKDLDVSFVGVYSYAHNRLLSYRDSQLKELGEVLKDAGRIIGFSINRFDIPVLEKYFEFNLGSIPTFDLLDEIEISCGHRISLDLLAKANIGTGKTNHSLDAVHFYNSGDWESLEKYCLNDVVITRDLYDLAKKQGYLMIPERNSLNLNKVTLDPQRFYFDDPNTLF